jgi:hypothetical protein
VIVEALRSSGISMAAALRGVGISEADFQSPGAKISIDDTVRIYQNALASVRDPFFAYKAGLKLHLVAYGLYGFAVLSSRNFRQTCKFVINYHDLADPLVTLSFEETAHHGIWSIEPLDHPAVEGLLYRFVVEFQRDTYGPSQGCNGRRIQGGGRQSQICRTAASHPTRSAG